MPPLHLSLRFPLFFSSVPLLLLHFLATVCVAHPSPPPPTSLSFALSLVLAGPIITALIIPVRLSSRTAPVMVCSTTPPWAEMLLVPHQSTSCPARCLRTCTVESHNRSAGPGCFSRLSLFSLLWCSAESQDFQS